MLQDEVLMELAYSSHCVTGFKLDVPVSTCNQFFYCCLENFIGVVLNGFEFVCSQVVLVQSVLSDSKLRCCSTVATLLVRKNREIVFPELIFSGRQLGDLLIDFVRLFASII